MAFNGITLYNFRGVNGVDTPIFDSLKDQESYFGFVPHLEIESSYYPPLFDNTLTLSADYFNWGDSSKPNENVWNYLSLQSAQGKTFYYFINDITYVSEDMVSVTIRMDTIQSYMFEMRLSRAFISRKAIRRWNKDGTINRDFVRENLSTGEMVLKSVESNQEQVTDKGVYWFLVKTSDTLLNDSKTFWAKNFNDVTTGVLYTELGKYQVNGTSVQFSSYCYLVPVSAMPIFLKDPSGGKENYGILGNDFIQFLAKDSRVQSITLISPTAISNLIQYDFYTPSDLKEEICELSIPEIMASDQQSTYRPLGLFGKFSDGTATSLCGFYFTIRNYSFKNPTMSDFFGKNSFSMLRFFVNDGNLEITQNTKRYIAFSPSFVPCMVDEQYYGIALRYQGQEIFPPYHYATSPRYTAYLTSDLEGNSYANVEIATNFKASGANQGYLGACASFGAVQLPLYTDPWRDYKVGHQGSYITDWIASALGGLGSMSKAVGSGILIAESAGAKNDYAQNYQARTQAIQNQATGLANMSTTLGEYITGFNTLIEKMPKSNIMRDAKTGRFVKVV